MRKETGRVVKVWGRGVDIYLGSEEGVPEPGSAKS
jgi:hypothetical protein